MTGNIIGFPNASHRNRTLRQARAQNGQNMHTFLFRSYDLIVESEEADLVRDVCCNIDRAQTKLRRVKQRLKDVQAWAASQEQLLTAADTKLTAAIVAALLSTRGGAANG
jgi:hypothetical protein